MKELVVISGKGGTGKTSVVAAFASLAQGKVLCDADVDAADLHLIMNPKVIEDHDFTGGNTAIIDQDKCSQCGLCRDLCRWEAISENFVVDSIECEGCGVCYYFCPEKAIDFPEKVCGKWFVSETRFGPMVHASLGIAEENSGKLVTLVRQEAKKLAETRNLNLIITDGPPGVGCPVIASIGGAKAVLVVAEPTVSGQHDMERVLELTSHFGIPALLCVNKFDLNLGATRTIETVAEAKGVQVMGRIGFDPIFTKAMVEGKSVIEFDGQCSTSEAMRKVWSRVEEFLNK